MTYDSDVDAAYVYLQPPTVVEPSVATTLTVNADVNLDFDSEGRLVGVEILRASILDPELLAGIDDAP
jgi:uncharacterized protein YuzE